MQNQCLTTDVTLQQLYDVAGFPVYFDNTQTLLVYVTDCYTAVSLTLEWLLIFAFSFFMFFSIMKFIIKTFSRIL